MTARFICAWADEHAAQRWNDAEQALDKAEQLSTKTDDKEYVWFLRGRLMSARKSPGRS